MQLFYYHLEHSPRLLVQRLLHVNLSQGNNQSEDCFHNQEGNKLDFVIDANIDSCYPMNPVSINEENNKRVVRK